MEYIFVYDLENDKEIKKGEETDRALFYGVRYYKTDNGIMVEVGDNLRHEIIVEGKYWNRILRIIKNNELDNSGVDAIVSGLMWAGLPEEFRTRFIAAVREGRIKEFENMGNVEFVK